ncbi:MAG: ribosome small subunit-dependent GTPase A [Clostridia bacterium]
MPTGVILKGIGGFYYVKTEQGIIECKARGKFRKDDVSPMVGDHVEIEISAHDDGQGSIENIFRRRNFLIRPPVANVDQLVIVASVSLPAPNILLLDKLLTVAAFNSLDMVICFNKIDLDTKKEYLGLCDIYRTAGYHVISTSSHTKEGIEELRQALKGKITAFAGASGVGKSSLLNTVDSRFKLQTGEISKKIDRGKHTTRHVELLQLDEDSFVLDTPGFTSFELTNIRAEELPHLFKEYDDYYSSCKYRSCTHIKEPQCAIKKAVLEGKLSQSRYDSYSYLYNQLKDIKEWQR